MTDVVSVKFNARGKSYFFDPNGNNVKMGDTLIVETSKGLDVGECVIGNHAVEDETLIPPLRPVIRVANAEDMKAIGQSKDIEKQAFAVCKEKIDAHKLDMKLVSVECGFDGNKILFFFTSDGRVDFRELVKDLASVFRTRIELRQIGVRDETKMLGGLGICGRPYCCNQFLNDFEPVSTKMAKTQSMSLNPTKISGSCGRLMCCLRYEQEAYEELVKTIPKNGAFVQTTGGYGNVVNSNVLRQKIKVRIDGEGDQEVKVFSADQVAVISGGRPKPGEQLPKVLHYVEKKDEPIEVADDPWKAPTLFADTDEKIKLPMVDGPAALRLEQNGGKNEQRRQNRNRPRPQGNGAAQYQNKPANNGQGASQPKAQGANPPKPAPAKPHRVDAQGGNDGSRPQGDREPFKKKPNSRNANNNKHRYRNSFHSKDGSGGVTPKGPDVK